MRNFSHKEIATLKEAIAKKKDAYPQDWLGRALAYTPYQPRSFMHLKRTQTQPICKISYLKGILDLKILEQIKNDDADVFMLDTLESVTYLRRYLSTPLIYDFLILDSYQLLEALVYGADCICLYPKYLPQEKLKEFSDYAIKIGLERIFHIDSKEDLTKAIFAKADFLNISNHSELVTLIPNNKIILGTLESKDSNYMALDSIIIDFN